MLIADKHCSDVWCDGISVPQIDRKSKQVKEQWHRKFYLHSIWGKTRYVKHRIVCFSRWKYNIMMMMIKRYQISTKVAWVTGPVLVSRERVCVYWRAMVADRVYRIWGDIWQLPSVPRRYEWQADEHWRWEIHNNAELTPSLSSSSPAADCLLYLVLQQVID